MNIFKERGIDPELRDARGYARWERGDLDAILDTDPGFRVVEPPQLSAIRHFIGQQPGWVIRRWPVMPGLEPILAELRPDDAVQSAAPEWHEHPNPAGGWRGHVDRKPEVPGFRTTARGLRVFEARGHGGENVAERHGHHDWAKYWHVPQPYQERRWKHRHPAPPGPHSDPAAPLITDVADDQRAFTSHLRHIHSERRRREHPGWSDGFGYEHEHVDRVKDETNPIARRLDAHPWARTRFSEAEVLFFGIEGCLKADAMLSHILRRDLPASVFSVPAVAQWHAPELERFVAEVVGERTVYVVPDADWIEKPDVIREALTARMWLARRIGEDRVHVAAPPISRGHKGVDDFLAAGNDIEELVKIDKKLPSGYAEWIGGRRPGAYANSVTTDAVVLRYLAMRADNEGNVRASRRSIAAAVEKPERTVGDSIRRLVDIGAVTTDKPLKEGQDYWSGRTEWVEHPTFTIDPDLRGRWAEAQAIGR
jgi:hypothetical protein